MPAVLVSSVVQTSVSKAGNKVYESKFVVEHRTDAFSPIPKPGAAIKQKPREFASEIGSTGRFNGLVAKRAEVVGLSTRKDGSCDRR